MSASELAAIQEALEAAGPVPAEATPVELRAGFSTMMAERPVAADLRFETTEVGGVRGVWAEAPGVNRQCVVLHLHGGAFVVGSAWDARGMTGEIARASGARGLAIDYGLAPEHPYPAAVRDCLASYRGLLDQGIEAGAIAVTGDSAGGGLALGLLCAIRDAGLPTPAAAALFSPWVDLACPGSPMRSRPPADPIVTRAWLQAMAKYYAPVALAEASPLGADLSGLPPLLIQVASDEFLLDDAVRLAEKAGAAGTFVSLEIWPQMFHVWHIYASELSEARRAIAAAGVFIAARLGRE